LEINNNPNKKSKETASLNREAFKHAIGMLESSGGKKLDNPTSSAAGKYHFLYSLIKKDPDMKGISKRQFIGDPELQEKIMDKALDGKLEGFTYGEGYAKKLINKYQSDADVNDVSALIHFLGPQGTDDYLSNPDSYVVPGTNLSGQEYVSKFRKHFDSFTPPESKPEPIPEPKRSLFSDNMKKNLPVREMVAESTSIAQPQMKQIPNINQFLEGGQISGQVGSKITGDASDLVTMFENGGSHEQNSLGGIPQGTGSNGKPNLVEEGETKWNDYIFSNAISLDGSYDISGQKGNVFKDGGKLGGKKKGKTTSESNEIGQSKPMTSALRNMLPLPQNGAQLLASLANEDSTYTTKDGGSKANEHLYRSVRNAVKRTGKNKGGTEYKDYSPQIDNDLNSLRMNAADMALGSVLSPELEAATTYGRVSYDFDPKTGNVKIYDTYDFNKTPGGKGVYSNIRSAAGNASKGKLDSTPKLIGEFNMNDDPDDVKFMDVVNNVLNPIDALDIDYSSIKKATNKASEVGNKIYDGASKVGNELYKKGNKLYRKGKEFINSFEDGGELMTGGKDKKKNTSSEMGPIEPESAKYPLKFTKTQSKFHKKGSDMYVDDIRDKYMGSTIPFQNTVPEGEVDFQGAVQDESAKAFLERYNNTWTRNKMKEQAGLTDYDIDNMILRGLNATKQVGGNVPGSKGSYDSKENVVKMDPEHEHNKDAETHERVHASGFDAAQGLNLLNVLGNSFQQGDSRNFLKKFSPETLRYLNMPHEAYGNFVEFREKLGLKPGQKITPKKLKKLVKEKDATMENFYRAFNDENITEALNTIAMQDNGNSINDYKIA